MISSPAAVPLYPQLDFPEDPSLADLPKLFNAEWVWDSFCRQFGAPDIDPAHILIRQFSHSRGRVALVSYELEWPVGEYIPSQHLAIRAERGKPAEFLRYPEDRRLPGLGRAAHSESALELLNRHVLAVRARRARVELVRYRPTSRAVLRHSVGRVRFYARVLRPGAIAPLLEAQKLIARSAFVTPRLAGSWPDGGVVWFSEIPGRNLRQRILKGRLPEPEPLLEGLQSLWNAADAPDGARPFNLAGAYRRARRSFSQAVGDGGPAHRSLARAVRALDPFVESWRPAGIAHNDFYDDQMLVLPDGRIALVDFEETGPGDAMLDIGNFLAHLRWTASFGRTRKRDNIGRYCAEFRSAALARFRWSAEDLALREAVCLFRVCTNTIRRPRGDWRDRLAGGLSLVNDTLG